MRLLSIQHLDSFALRADCSQKSKHLHFYTRFKGDYYVYMHIASLDELIGMGLSLSFRSLAAYACGAIFNAAAAAAAAAGRKRASERERSLSVRPVRPYSPPVRVLQ